MDLIAICHDAVETYLLVDISNICMNYLYTWKLKYYANGNLNCRYAVIDGKGEGECIVYYGNAVIQAKYYFKNDMIDGEFKQWSIKGNLIHVRNYHNGKLNGTSITLFPSGKIKSKMNYIDDVLAGEFMSCFGNGEYYTAFYVNDKKEGQMLIFDSNDVLTSSIDYVDDKKHGKCCKYTNNVLRQVTEYKSDIQDGEFVAYSELGILIVRAHYCNDMLHGSYELFDEIDGSLMISAEYNCDVLLNVDYL